MTPSVLVTGAGGYIGQRLVGRLVADRIGVRALGKAAVPWPADVTEYVGDAADADLVARAADGADVVIHLAGANEVAMSEDPEGAQRATLEAARVLAHAGVGRVIYFSTVHVYGSALAPGAVVSETTPPRPSHPYGASRLECERIFAEAVPDTLVLRLTNGVGAPARPDVDRWSLVANDLCRSGATTGRLVLKTHGAQWRDFIALSDVERMVSAIVRSPIAPGVYNLGSGEPVTVRTLAGLVQDAFVACGSPRPELVAPPMPAELPAAYQVDVTKLAAAGHRASTPLAEALEGVVRFCVAHARQLA